MKKFKVLITVAVCVLMLAICASALVACEEPIKSSVGYQKNPNLDDTEVVNLCLLGSADTWEEMDIVIASFQSIYPNCTIQYQKLEDYTSALEARLLQTESPVDIFTSVNIQSTSPIKDLALNLISAESKKILDLSDCNDGLVENYKYTSAENTQYAVPICGLMRGMFVNKTLLAKYGLKTPTNKAELMNCCKVLTENGHIGIQCPADNLGQQLLYPSMCNTIANAQDAQAVWNKVQNCEEGVSELFRKDYELYYDMIKKGYVNFSTNGKGKELLNLEKQADATYKKIDDVGNIGFVVDTQAMAITLDKDKSDYHSPIEYEFIASPVGDEGGYAYLSPGDGLAINKSSQHTDWALEFLNYFFSAEINTKFSEASGQIPNTKDAMLKYNISADRMSTVGQVTFDYGDAPSFYNTVTMLTRNGYAYDRFGSFSDSYSSVNANYLAVFPDDTYYSKLATPFYEAVDSQYADANKSSIYKFDADLSSYSKADTVYYAAHPDETYYRLVNYVQIDKDYIVANPTEKIYRHIAPMEGMPFMRVQDKNGDYVKNPDGTYELKYTLEEYMTRLETEFRIARAYKYGQ